jgi:hypothetical protein
MSSKFQNDLSNNKKDVADLRILNFKSEGARNNSYSFNLLYKVWNATERFKD